MVKEFGVGDVSKAYLTNFRYLLIMIQYLQKVKVLPVLHELYDGENQPVPTVEGFNKTSTWFQEDLNFIATRFTSPNKDSLSQLWIGFLDYFVGFKFEKEKLRHGITQKMVFLQKP